DKRKRYATADALADDLGRFGNGEPIHARPTPPWERLGKWARRKPAQAALIAALGLAMVACTTGAVFYALYKDQQATGIRRQLERRRQVDDLWVQGQQAEAAGQLAAAQECWDQALASLEADEGAVSDDVRRQIQQCRDRVRQQLRDETARHKLL